jgi:mannose-6-phosphate isomerase class I
MSYDAHPRYPLATGTVAWGYEPLAASLRRDAPVVLAVDGPPTLDWDTLRGELVRILEPARMADARTWLSWASVQEATAGSFLPGDPVFGRLHEGTLAELLGPPPRPDRAAGGPTLVLGPGSALAEHDVLWYADAPKRLALEAVRAGRAPNLGQPANARGSEQRLAFVDWPVLDRHKQALLPRLDRYVDATDPARPGSLTGEQLRRSLAGLARRPFRTLPTFLPGPWGGSWLQDRLGVDGDGPNLAWSYELIAPESSILLGDEPVEVGFEWLMGAEAHAILGSGVADRFGSSFPIRLDYLDTVGGGNLSIQCHPSERYARETFGLPYTQHETYYVVDTTPGARIFLGLREDADVAELAAAAATAAADGTPFDPERFVQAHPALRHQLYLIPAGTIHASGAGSLVLEVSATPYLYTLRFYDWLRRDLTGKLRPVHLDHALANLDPTRRGEAVRTRLIREPRPVRDGDGWVELDLGGEPELFFAVHRVDFDRPYGDTAGDRFHVLNLVEGERVEIEAGGSTHPLSYAETIVVPAAAGAYRVRPVDGTPCKLVKAFVR